MTNRNCLTCKYQGMGKSYGDVACNWHRYNAIPQSLLFRNLFLEQQGSHVFILIDGHYLLMNCPAWQPKEGGDE